MKREVKLYRVMKQMLNGMLADVDESELMEPPVGGGNSPAWILGHLTLANQLGLSLLGTGQPSKKLLVLFGPGSKPEFDANRAPSIAELKAEFEQTAEAFTEAALKATPESLDVDRDGELLTDILPTVGDMIGHLLTTHFSLHIGQFSAWRRGRGLPSILKV